MITIPEVISPNLNTLPYIIQNGVKVYEIVAEPVRQEILEGVLIEAWGYNGSTPGPTIIMETGDRVRLIVHNRLPQRTSIHWHGMIVPNVMDGVPVVEPSPYIEPGASFAYEFVVKDPPGTHIYHSHVNTSTQVMMGLSGNLVILPPGGHADIDRDFSLQVQQWKLDGQPTGQVKTGVFKLDPHSMLPNFFTINGKSFPNTEPMTALLDQSVLFRWTNVQQSAHPMHLHGYQFAIVGLDGNPLPPHQQVLKNTINVASGETFDVRLRTFNPGVWPFHCHKELHLNNNQKPGTGGMFTTFVVYDRIN